MWWWCCGGVLRKHSEGWNDVRAKMQVVDFKTDSLVYLKSVYSIVNTSISIVQVDNPIHKLLIRIMWK